MWRHSTACVQLVPPRMCLVRLAQPTSLDHDPQQAATTHCHTPQVLTYNCSFLQCCLVCICCGLQCLVHSVTPVHVQAVSPLSEPTCSSMSPMHRLIQRTNELCSDIWGLILQQPHAVHARMAMTGSSVPHAAREEPPQHTSPH